MEKLSHAIALVIVVIILALAFAQIGKQSERNTQTQLENQELKDAHAKIKAINKADQVAIDPNLAPAISGLCRDEWLRDGICNMLGNERSFAYDGKRRGLD